MLEHITVVRTYINSGLITYHFSCLLFLSLITCLRKDGKMESAAARRVQPPPDPVEAATAESPLPLPQTLCHSSIPSSTEKELIPEEEQLSYDEKRKFWERVSSTESGASSTTTTTSERRSMSRSGSSSAKESMKRRSTEVQESSVESSSSYSRGFSMDSAKVDREEAVTASSSDYSMERELLGSGQAEKPQQPHVLPAVVPCELSEEEILQQISPEKKEHFDTFVAPSLQDEDSKDEALEEKAIPLTRQDVTIDKERLVTRQIKGDIFDSELEQHEDSVMTSDSILQEPTTLEPEEESFSKVLFVTAPSEEDVGEEFQEDYETHMRQIEQTFEESAAELGQKVTTTHEEVIRVDLGRFEGTIDNDKVRPRQGSLLASDPVTGEVKTEELIQTRRLSREEATVIAQGLLTDLETKAIDQVKSLMSTGEDDLNTCSDEEMEFYSTVKKVAQSFVVDLGKKASEIAEQISSSSGSREGLLDLEDKDAQDEEEKKVMVQFSAEISDSDLQTDLTEMRAELEHFRESEVIVSEDISDADMKADVHESYFELMQQLDDMREEQRDRDTFDEISSAFRGLQFYFTSSFRAHFVDWFDHDQDSQGLGLAQGTGQEIGPSDDVDCNEHDETNFGSGPEPQHKDHADFSSQERQKAQDEDIWASEEAKVVLRRDTVGFGKKSDDSPSSKLSGGENRRSGVDFDVGLSSSGDNYCTAGEGGSSSRPSSSDVEAMYSARSGKTLTTTEYDTANSQVTTLTSDEYHTAVSSLTSKESLHSLDTSESSGNLGSVEVSEGISEGDSLLDAVLDPDRDMITPTGPPPNEQGQAFPGSIVLGDNSSATEVDTDDGNNEDGSVSPAIVPNMKRSQEMVFQPEMTVIYCQPSSDEVFAEEEQLSGSILTISSASDATIVTADKKPEDDRNTVVPREIEKLKEESQPSLKTESAPLPRVVSFEATVAFDIPDDHYSDFRGQKSFDSEFGSRPESELKDLESRPQSLSEAMLSRSSSEDPPRPMSKEDLSDSEVPIMLKTHNEPFDRPVSPEPPRDDDDLAKEASAAAFSAHFSQVVEETTMGEDFEGHECGIVPEVQIFQAVEQTKGDAEESPATVLTKPIGVKYWPAPDDTDVKETQDGDNAKSTNNESSQEKEIQDGTKWLEKQFDNASANVASEESGEEFFYSQPLDQIAEEEETDNNERELEKLKESLSQAGGDFDGKKNFIFRSDKDDISMSSLQEFEKLEKDLASAGSRGSMSSQDSLEAGPIKVAQMKLISKSGVGDDVSVDSSASLIEFEKLEHACKEAALIEKIAKEQEDVLSEIEEGHESQVSEATDSGETLSDAGQSDNNSDDFEERMFQIDEIIKQAQTNVERFNEGDAKSSTQPAAEMLPLEDILGRHDSWTESTGLDRTASAGSPNSDSLEDNVLVPELPPEAGRKKLQESDLMQKSADSLELNKKMQTSTDSLEARSGKSNNNVMIISSDSIEQEQKKEGVMAESTDSLEGRSVVPMDTSSQSFHQQQRVVPMEKMAASTDSLEESCSTRATASMQSSGASGTMVVADLEHDGSKKSKDTTMNVVHSQVSFGHHVTEVVQSCDDDNFHHVVERTVELPASLSRVSFTGPNAEEKMKKYMAEHLGGNNVVQETEYVDDRGNVVKKKIIQQKRITKEDDKYCEAVLDEHGNRLVKGEPEDILEMGGNISTIEVIAERRLQQGVTNPCEQSIFKTSDSIFPSPPPTNPSSVSATPPTGQSGSAAAGALPTRAKFTGILDVYTHETQH